MKVNSLNKGPYQIFRCVSNISYELELPADLPMIHMIFPVPLLKTCVGDMMSILPLEIM